MKSATVKAYAKINITLNVTGVENGYHNLDTVVVTVDKFDKVTVTKRKDDKILLNLVGKYANYNFIQENFNAYKAALKFKEKFNTCGVTVTVERNIPEGSGMGGELGVYTWKNGFRKFKHTREKYRHDNSFTPEKWAEVIGIPLEELKKVILVDIDWSRQATIEHIELFYGAMVDDDYWTKYDFIDCYTDYDADAPYNEDLEEFDNEAWLNDYIIAMRDAGYSEKEIQKVIEEERNNIEDLNNDKKNC